MSFIAKAKEYTVMNGMLMIHITNTAIVADSAGRHTITTLPEAVYKRIRRDATTEGVITYVGGSYIADPDSPTAGANVRCASILDDGRIIMYTPSGTQYVYINASIPINAK